MQKLGMSPRVNQGGRLDKIFVHVELCVSLLYSNELSIHFYILNPDNKKTRLGATVGFA